MRRLLNKLVSAARGDSGGTALVTSLLFMVMLTALGMASIMTATTEIKVSRNYRLNILALDHANAGVQAALAKMDSDLIYTGTKAFADDGDDYFPGPPEAADEHWFVNASSIDELSDKMYFSAIISYKKEDRLHTRDGGPDDDQVVAYTKDCGYPKAAIADLEAGFPVYLIVSTGKVKVNGRVLAKAKVQAEVAKNTADLRADSAVVSGACVDFAGHPTIRSDTLSEPGGCRDVNKTGVQANYSTCSLSPSESTGINSNAGNTAPKFESDAEVDVDNMFNMSVEDLIGFADTKVSPQVCAEQTFTNEVYGVWDTDARITYFNTIKPDPDTGDLTPTYVKLTNCAGFGILIVDGDLDIAGTFEWDGIIYVRGKVTLMGGGGGDPDSGKNIRGVVAGTEGVVVKGTSVTISYDQCNNDKIMDLAFTSKIINWKRVYNY